MREVSYYNCFGQKEQLAIYLPTLSSMACHCQFVLFNLNGIFKAGTEGVNVELSIAGRSCCDVCFLSENISLIVAIQRLRGWRRKIVASNGIDLSVIAEHGGLTPLRNYKFPRSQIIYSLQRVSTQHHSGNLLQHPWYTIYLPPKNANTT